MKFKNDVQFVELIQGIKFYISRNRSSISNEDLVLLEECVEFLEGIQKQRMSLGKFSKAMGMLIKVLSTASDIIDYLY